METQCTTEQMEFQHLGQRGVIGRFDGGKISSDAGGVLLREVEKRTDIVERLAGCFRDYRDQDRIEHRVGSLIRQRVYGIALGYEDLNDHDSLRHDVVMGLLSEKQDPSGRDRVREQDQGKAIAGKSTLNRLELTPEDANEKSRYKKIVADQGAIDELMVAVFIESYESAPSEVVLDCFTAIRRGSIFTGIMQSIAICRCISSVVSTCCVRGYARPMRIRPAGCSKR
jgi:hypothetical protein